MRRRRRRRGKRPQAAAYHEAQRVQHVGLEGWEVEGGGAQAGHLQALFFEDAAAGGDVVGQAGGDAHEQRGAPLLVVAPQLEFERKT